ncbi:hypothetical protein BTUL_0088g00280 [Botrytis tulipae]|uniref:Uncharacterized protein n=1 Tax=Botrytis tulipae TaxID=87230 RepID=A0A4Z1ENY3_9HELO|nr:hypothetical protein BTUL_0088g00280 [Botrytis tulipae]
MGIEDDASQLEWLLLKLEILAWAAWRRGIHSLDGHPPENVRIQISNDWLGLIVYPNQPRYLVTLRKSQIESVEPDYEYRITALSRSTRSQQTLSNQTFTKVAECSGVHQ